MKWLARLAVLGLFLAALACNRGPGNSVAANTDSAKGSATSGGGAPTNGTNSGTNPAKPPQRLTALIKEDVKLGKGPAAAVGDTLVCLYTGKLPNGTEFDSNDKKDGTPMGLVLGVSTEIEGFTEGIVGMKVGGERKLSIPSKMAYGENGNLGQIPPNQDLYFDIKLIGLVKKGEEGVFDTPVDVKLGTGAPIKTGDNVTVDYAVSFVNGTSIYSTKESNKPNTFTVGVTDPNSHTDKASGFTAAIQGMREGGVRTFVLPPLIAYRPNQKIPANEILKFRVELTRVNKRGRGGK